MSAQNIIIILQMSHHGHVIHDLKQLQQLVKSKGSVLIDFHATWCGPCVRISPYVHKATTEAHVTLATVDVDQAEDVAQHFGISSMPTFVVIKGGVKKQHQVFRQSGGSEGVVNQAIAKAK